ncbi:hypothetical protein GEMRC1_010517 [Eukaryota sp. GEM-RC1]
MFGEQVILNRRQKESVRNSYVDYTVSHHKLASVAGFEQRILHTDQNSRISVQYQRLIAEKAARIDERRRKIAAKYAYDMEQWLSGLQNLQETLLKSDVVG